LPILGATVSISIAIARHEVAALKFDRHSRRLQIQKLKAEAIVIGAHI